MRNGYVTGCAIAMVMTAVPAMAQEDVERYQLQRTPDGYVRLDTTSGSMSLCQEKSGQLVCRMATEERTAYEGDLDRLQDRVDALEARVGELESDGATKVLPHEKELEQTLDYMDRFFRSFMGIVRDFEQDNQKAAPAIPNRT